jgi:alanyl-tRNA synthetase
MAENGQNRLPGIAGLLQVAARVLVAAEAARRQSESASRYATAGHRSAVAAATLIARENQNAIRDAQEAIRLNQAGEAARFARVIQEAKKTSWSAATPRQRLLGPSPSMLAELAESKRFGEQSWVLGAVSGTERQTFLDLARRITENHQAHIAAVGVNSQPGVLQSLATQAAKAKAITDAIARAVRRGAGEHQATLRGS